MVKRLMLILGYAGMVMSLAGCFPNADAGQDKQIVTGLAVTMDGSGSSELLGQGLTFHWVFSDGFECDGEVVSHTFADTGDYIATLEVTDKDDVKNSDTAAIEVISFEELSTPVTAFDSTGAGYELEAPLVECLADGRMVLIEGNSDTQIEIALESGAKTREFTFITAIEGTSGTWNFASFAEVVDDNAIIVGCGDKIYRVDLVTGAVDTIAVVNNYDGMIDGDLLYYTVAETDPVTWESIGYVRTIDLSDPDPGSTQTDLVSGIPGASAGICLDANKNIYTGNGYSNSGIDETGLIKRFSPEDLPEVWASGSFVADILSAGSLIWDDKGILLVGGGDLYGDSGDKNNFAAVDVITGEKIWQLDPDTQGAASSYKLNSSKDADCFAASIWNYPSWGSSDPGEGTIYIAPFSALGL